MTTKAMTMTKKIPGTDCKGKPFNYVLFTAEDFANYPENYSFNNYKESKDIFVRLDKPSTRAFDKYRFCEEISKTMQTEDVLDMDIKLSINDFIDACNAGTIVINNKDIKDRMQRDGNAMPDSTAAKLFVSQVNGDCCMPPIQTMIVEEAGKHKLYIIDGMQRSNAIRKYFLSEKAIDHTDTKLDKMYFCNLPVEIQEAVGDRLIPIRILHESLKDYRPFFFKTLNTTSTKMTQGELVNTKYYDHFVTELATLRMDNNNVKNVFLPIKTDSDTRNNGRAELIFAVATYYMYHNGFLKTKGNGKNAVIDEFMNIANKMPKERATIEKLFDLAPSVCEMMNRYFGKSFCKKIPRKKGSGAKKSPVVMTANPIFPATYHPFGRSGVSCSCYTSTMFFTIMGLYSIIDSMKKEAVEEIAQNIDSIFGDDVFHYKYNASVSTADIFNRMNYVWNEGVQPVLDKYGYKVV